MRTTTCTPLCLKAVGLELPHMSGSRPWICLQLLGPEGLLHQALPRPDILPDPMPRLQPRYRLLLDRCKGRQGHKAPKRYHYGHCRRWPFHFYLRVLPNKGLLLPCSTLAQLRIVFWVQLHDPLPWPPIIHLLCSDPVQHPCTKQLLWKTHRRYTLASLWPNCKQVLEETDCGCGVRVTLRFDEVLATSPLPDLEEPPCGEWGSGPLGF